MLNNLLEDTEPYFMDHQGVRYFPFEHDISVKEISSHQSGLRDTMISLSRKGNQFSSLHQVFALSSMCSRPRVRIWGPGVIKITLAFDKSGVLPVTFSPPHSFYQ